MSASGCLGEHKLWRKRLERQAAKPDIVAQACEHWLEQTEEAEYQRELQYMEFDEDLYEDSVFQNLTDLSEGKCDHPYYWEVADEQFRRKRLN